MAIPARTDDARPAPRGRPGRPSDLYPLLAVVADRAWIDDAICGPFRRLFFEPHGERPSARMRRERQAKAVCAQCPARVPCLQAGRRNRESGIWGGETEEERAAAGFGPRGVTHRRVAAARDASRTSGQG